MSVINTQPLIGASGQGGGYNIDRSLRFRASATGYLSRTPTTPTNGAIWTLSCWVKRGALGTTQEIINASNGSPNQCSVQFTSADQLRIINYTSSVFRTQYVTTQVFRDPSAWYHIVIKQNSSTGFTLYVNGQAVTSFGTATGPDTTGWLINQSGIAVNIGRETLGGVNLLDGYLADFFFIDGQALTPSSFGETDTITGVWKPKKYAGTYGTNGFYLNFKDNSAATAVAIGKDSSGNGNNYTPTNISVTTGVTYDSMTDVPTLTSATAANYCVLNPLKKFGVYTLANGNMQVSVASSTATVCSVPSTLAVSSGKYYWETTISALSGGIGSPIIGVCDANLANNTTLTASSLAWLYYGYNGYKYNGAATAAYGSTWGLNAVIGIAFDMDAGTIVFYLNGTSQGTAFTNLAGNTVTPVVYHDQGTNGYTVDVNFGQRPFSYTPPTGYKALNTYNLPDSTIVAGNKVMDATTYTGNGSSQSITNAASFKPDLVWAKNRGTTNYNVLTDSVRGVQNQIYSNTTDVEATGSNGLTAFNSNGFSVGTNANWNNNTYAFVAWQWQAGQGITSSNASGSITSTVSVNASAGFSIVTYTGTGTAGATVGHGLGVAPSLVIVKNRSLGSSNWAVYSSALGVNGLLFLNATDAFTSVTGKWSGTNSSVVGLNSATDINQSGVSHVAYCWAEVVGFSKFGSYTGNASTDGPFVYTGFRPKWILWKNASSAVTNWQIFDTSRDGYNQALKVLNPNLSDAEANTTSNFVDILSNGFKIRGAGATVNGSGNTIIYAAFAENPLKNSLAR